MDCTHEVQYSGLCAVCGTLLETRLNDPLGIPICNTLGLTITREEAERLASENTKKLIESRKLSLIVDLDQTFVHVTCNTSFKGDDIQSFKISEKEYLIKLRPGLVEFLNKIKSLYELHIYTLGTREYADHVTEAIDPNRTLLTEKIFSRDEIGSVTQKKLQRLFPCDTTMLVVLDDRSDIWGFSPHLIRIKPFEYFNQPLTQDQELNTTTHILQEIHSAFYSSDISLPQMKQKLFQPFTFTFSPDLLKPFKDPTLSWLWQTSRSFGATCSMDLTGKTTHLITTGRDQEPVGFKVVHPGWILDSTARWSIQPEEDYSVEWIEKEEEEEEGDLIRNVDWDETNREVEDFMNESGIDDIWDTDSDSSCSVYLKRKRIEDKRLSRVKRGKSHLSKVASSQCTSGNTTDNEDSSLDDFAVILDKSLD